MQIVVYSSSSYRYSRTLRFLYSIIRRKGIKPEHLCMDNFANQPGLKPLKWQAIINRADSLFDGPYVVFHYRNMFIFCHIVQCDTHYYLACVESLELSISQYVGHFETIVCIDMNDLVGHCIWIYMFHMQVIINGMSLTYMILIDSTPFLLDGGMRVVA